ncbi:MAG: hypothetical protein ABEJ86_05625 [Halococcoides sp.]
MTWLSRAQAFGALALIGVAVALVVAVAPETIPETLRSVDTGGDRVEMALLFAGLVLALLGAVATWAWRTSDRAGAWVDLEVESAEREVDIAGADRTDAVEQWRERLPGAPGRDHHLATADGEPLRGPLRDLLVDLLDDADRPIANGEWTDDPIAAAFLGDDDAVDYPFSHRLYAWLYPGRAYDRRVRRSLRAVEAVCEDRIADYERPERIDRSRLGRLRAALGGDRS